MYAKFDLYNSDTKIAFVQYYSKNLNTQETILYDFQKSKILEEQLGRDLAEFNYSDISMVAKNLSASNKASIKRTLSVFAEYRDWYVSIDKKKGDLGINFFKMYANTENVSDFIPVNKIKNMYITQEELDIIVSRLINAQDKALISALYAGIRGEELSELRNLKIDKENPLWDKDSWILKLKDKSKERKIKISEELYGLLKKADKQQEVIINNGVYTEGMKSTLRPLKPSQYVFKPITNRTSDPDAPMEVGTMNTAIRRIRGYEEGAFDFITPSSIYSSGMINKVVKSCEQSGNNIEDTTTRDLSSILEEYQLNYAQTYNVLQKLKLIVKIK